MAHEVAHHLAATRGFILQAGEDLTDEESIANLYAAQVMQKPSARWSYRLGQKVSKEISEWHYSFALVDWRQKKYQQAAQRFYDAWSLNPDNKEAGDRLVVAAVFFSGYPLFAWKGTHTASVWGSRTKAQFDMLFRGMYTGTKEDSTMAQSCRCSTKYSHLLT